MTRLGVVCMGRRSEKGQGCAEGFNQWVHRGTHRGWETVPNHPCQNAYGPLGTWGWSPDGMGELTLEAEVGITEVGHRMRKALPSPNKFWTNRRS